MAFLERALSNLAQLGFYDFVLPFFLILAVLFGILQSRHTISDNANINGVIAVIVAFLGTYIGRGLFYTRLFSAFGMGLAALLVLVVLLGMFGFKPGDLFKGFSLFKPDSYMLPGLLFLIAVLIFATAFGWGFIGEIFSSFSWLFDKDTILTLLFVGVSVAAIVFVLAKGGSGGGDHSGGHGH